MEAIDLKYFAASAHAGSFAGAARCLNLNASTLCRRISRLEDELGFTLFERTRNGLHLTPGGRAIIGRVRSVLAGFTDLATAARSIGSGESGEVRLGIRMPPVGERLMVLLRRWRERAPKVTVTLCELNEREIYEGLLESKIDAALVRRDTLRSGVASEVLFRESILVALPVDHALASTSSVRWKELRDETLLVQGWEDSQTARELYAGFLGSGVHFQTQPASKQSILGLVAANYGITLVTASQAEVGVPGVVYRSIEEPDAWLEVEMAWIPGREDPVVGRFLSFARDDTRSCRSSRRSRSCKSELPTVRVSETD